jgi:hypothetical protein
MGNLSISSVLSEHETLITAFILVRNVLFIMVHILPFSTDISSTYSKSYRNRLRRSVSIVRDIFKSRA